MAATDERSTADLIGQLSDQAVRLASLEVALRRAELHAKGAQARGGAGLLGASTVFGLVAVGSLAACAILALSTTLDAWLAALIVGVPCMLLAGALGLAGRGRLRKAMSRNGAP